MAKIDHLLDLVIDCDDEGIEFARDEVNSQDLEALTAAYWELETWDQKGLLIHLIQDHVDPCLRDMLYDFLKAPDDERGDFVEVTKAIALSLLEEDRERFSVYYEDRELLARMVERALVERPMGHVQSKCRIVILIVVDVGENVERGVVVGRVEEGTVKPGDRLAVHTRTATLPVVVEKLQLPEGEQLRELAAAEAGQSVGLVLKGITNDQMQAGDVAAGITARERRALSLHQRVSNYNWDAGVEVLLWIIRDPDCDKATALMIYWRGGPEWDLQFADRTEVTSLRLETFDLLAEIEKRYQEGFYQLQMIDFDPRDDDGTDRTNVYPQILEKAKRQIPPLMYEPVAASGLLRASPPVGSDDAAVKQPSQPQSEASAVQKGGRRRSLWGWVLIVLGGAALLTGGLVLLLLLVMYFSSVPGVSDNPIGFVTWLVICPLPMLAVGLSLLVVGLLALRGAKKPGATESQQQVVDMPQFKYHSDPIATGSVVPSGATCKCCGQSRGFIYVGPVYGADAYPLRDNLCPWCIADGSAHEKYGAEFTDAAAIGGPRRGWDQVPDEVVEEVAYRTPGFSGWQQGRWWTHCGDAADFLGPAGRAEVEAYGPELIAALRADVSRMNDKNWQAYYQRLDKDRGPTAYVFRCPHCGKVGGYSDSP